MNDDLLLAIESHIRTLVNRFKGRASNFFTESDIHSYLYLVFYRDKLFSKQYPTADRSVKTILIHREYPTFFRFKKRLPVKPAREPAKRGHHDLVVLNPSFLAARPLSTVTNQDISAIPQRPKEKPLLAAFEFKMPRSRIGSGTLEEIEIDFQKLQLSLKWSQSLYMLIFNRHERMAAKWWPELERMAEENPDVKALYMENVGEGKARAYKVEYLGSWRP
jgi:hypothetical protein